MRLVTVAHGTRKSSGNAIAAELTAHAAQRLGVEAVCSYVELCDPLFAEVVAGSREPTVAVPLLLSTGFHIRTDLPEMAERAGGPLTLGRPFGPHRQVARAQAARLLEAGATPGSRVVLVAAGSSDELATRDQERAAELLAAEWRGEVVVATLTARGARPAEVVRDGDVVSPYLLSPGYFADRARRESLDAGAALVADVLGVHPLLVDLLCARYEALAAAVAGPPRAAG
ncbi:sirohydrochlorin chelatase [Nocardioides lentus]|uniref:Sirohydrochlorin chelatase n=1 Tax=Nocardioides lentus TaxID=338077 RepID=A0ABN2P869_9ACTN